MLLHVVTVRVADLGHVAFDHDGAEDTMRLIIFGNGCEEVMGSTDSSKTFNQLVGEPETYSPCGLFVELVP